MSPVFRRPPVTVVIAVLLALPGGCGEEPTSLEPLPAPEAGVVAGFVTSATEGALAEVTVRLEPLHGDRTATTTAAVRGSSGSARTAAVRVLITDENGFYAFPDVSEGEYALWATTENHLAGYETAHARASAETTIVDITLVPTGTVSGAVTLENAATHRNAIVYVAGTSWLAVTDDAGAFSVTGVPIGSHQVIATRPGYVDQDSPVTLSFAGEEVFVAFGLQLASNIAPVATIIPPPSAPAQTIFAPTPFDGSASDADGSVVLYEWDWEDDGTFDWSSASSPATAHQYTTAGTYVAKLRVTDDDGGIGLAAATVDVLDGLYVATTGSDANPGTRAAPFATISHAIAQAAPVGVPVVVANGTYNENVTLVSNVSVLGGRDPATWVRTSTSVVNLATGAVVADGVSDLQVSYVRFVAPATTNNSASVALRAVSVGATVQFNGCTFQAGNGGDALGGANGSNGLAGAAGQSGGLPASGNGGGTGGPRAGGAGGFGGCTGQTGQAGQNGFGGSGGSGGSGGAVATSGQPGAPGANGSLGQHGSGALSPGSVVGNAWVANNGTDGTVGGDGSGGGGGGGGGGPTGTCGIFPPGTLEYGGGGGGGGEGGQAGAPGRGGKGGGASIGALLLNASPTFSQCTFKTAFGGDGGPGGKGGIGGAGGGIVLGGGGDTGAGNGGWGWTGGKGGDGGGAQGGPGGPSIGIFRSGSSAPVNTSPTYTLGVGGTGGPGGMRSNNPGDVAPNGPAGAVLAVYP